MATSGTKSFVRPWRLTEVESFSSFNNWRSTITYHVCQDENVKQFFVNSCTWKKKSPLSPNRGLAATTVPVAAAEDRCTLLNQMLGLICQYAPHFFQNQIQNTSTSMQSIWSFIREYYRFAQSESTFMKFLDIRQEQEERPERLYYRLLSHIVDNLLCKDSKLLFEGVKVTEDEVMGPTIRRLIILNWLHVIHPGLPALLTRAFAFDLQRITLVDLFPQICESLDAFLDELKENDTVAAQVNYTDNRSGNRRPSNSSNCTTATALQI